MNALLNILGYPLAKRKRSGKHLYKLTPHWSSQTSRRFASTFASPYFSLSSLKVITNLRSIKSFVRAAAASWASRMNLAVSSGVIGVAPPCLASCACRVLQLDGEVLRVDRGFVKLVLLCTVDDDGNVLDFLVPVEGVAVVDFACPTRATEHVACVRTVAGVDVEFEGGYGQLAVDLVLVDDEKSTGGFEFGLEFFYVVGDVFHRFDRISS